MIEMIATVMVGFIIFIIFIALAFHNYNARNEIQDVYKRLLKDSTSREKDKDQTILDLKYLLQLSRLPTLEQTLLVTTDKEERIKIEELIQTIKEVIPDDKEI